MKARRSAEEVSAPYRARVMVVGAGWRFTSGISYYTCRLTNALAGSTQASALLMRQLVPTRFYPGRGRVGTVVNELNYAPEVPVFDGVDWFWGRSMREAKRFVDGNRPDVLVLQWWTGAVLHSYLHLAAMVRGYGGKVIIEWHEVQDTGEGIAPRDLPHVFERFYRSDASRARDASESVGAGIGLTVSRHLLEAMGGTIQVTSTEEQGTTVSVDLPRSSLGDSASPISHTA